MIKAMILGAGKGTRVRPLTDHLPKPMLPIINQPLIEHIILHLKSCGIEHMVINTSYRSADIENYLNDGSRLGVKLGFSFEGYLDEEQLIDKPLGSAGGMKKIQEFSHFFDDTFVVVCGDALIDIDFNAVIAFHKKNNALATIVMRDVPPAEVSKYGVVVTDSSGRITQFQEKPKQEEALSHSINTGIYVFEPAIFDLIPKDREYDIGSQLFPDLVKQGKAFFGITLPFEWVDVGCVADFWTANQAALTGDIACFRMPGTEIQPGIWLGENVSIDLANTHITPPIFIGAGSFIGAGARITGPCVIGRQSYIGAEASVKECLLDNHTFVAANTHIKQLIYMHGEAMDSLGNSIGKPSAAGLDAWLRDHRQKTAEPAIFPELTQSPWQGFLTANPTPSW